MAGPLLLAAALRDAQRVGGVAGDVVGAEVGVGGGVAGLEGGELQLGQAVGEEWHAAMESVSKARVKGVWVRG